MKLSSSSIAWVVSTSESEEYKYSAILLSLTSNLKLFAEELSLNRIFCDKTSAIDSIEEFAEIISSSSRKSSFINARDSESTKSVIILLLSSDNGWISASFISVTLIRWKESSSSTIELIPPTAIPLIASPNSTGKTSEKYSKSPPVSLETMSSLKIDANSLKLLPFSILDFISSTTL